MGHLSFSENAAWKETIFLKKTVLSLMERLPRLQIRCGWRASVVQREPLALLPMCLLQFGLVLTLYGHLFVLLCWWAAWLGQKLERPARPLVRKLQKVVSQRESACPPYGRSVLSDEWLGWKREMMKHPFNKGY